MLKRMWQWLFPPSWVTEQKGYDWAKETIKDDPHSPQIQYVYDCTNSYPLDDFDRGVRNYLRDLRNKQ